MLGKLDAAIKAELCLALHFLGAGHDLIGTVGSWHDSISDRDVLDGLRTWNDANSSNAKACIDYYETVRRHPVCTRAEGQKRKPEES